MEDANPVNIPAELESILSKSVGSQEAMDPGIPYREAVGSLLFAARVTRLDIEYAVNTVSQFVDNYNNTHWSAVKKIFRYLVGTIDCGIIYGASGSDESLVGYTDADYAGCPDTRRSRSGYVFMLNNAPLSWCSKKQNIVSLSTTEAEYIALGHGVKEAIWLKRMLKELGIQCGSVPMNVNNQSAIKLASNPEFHKRTKHIEVRYHFIREVVEKGTIVLAYVKTQEQLADIFTKPLPKHQLQYIRQKLRIMTDKI
ncbi:secreted RxLR effector protein 161-like [Cotesia glomerata]|uniref:secreted RxLR effector protein 161-like n=1 Tax=Cotesia glomerata TaxID=32391 RepID=UPI001D00C05D|nr:secreted RxLR effector protein 161-like [Cotesia glomerata]